jgi:hypothetical protein
VNGRWLNLFTGAVISALVMLSIILTASVLYPNLSGKLIVETLLGGSALGLAVWATLRLFKRTREVPIDRRGRLGWRMPPLAALPPPSLTRVDKTWMFVLGGYLMLAGGLVLARIVQLALAGLV